MINVVVLNCPSKNNDRNEGLEEISTQLDALKESEFLRLEFSSRMETPLNVDEVEFLRRKIQESQLILILVTVDFVASRKTKNPSNAQKIIKELAMALVENKTKIIPICYSTDNFGDSDFFLKYPMKLPSQSTIIDQKFNKEQQWDDVRSIISHHLQTISYVDLQENINELFFAGIDISEGGILCESEQYKLVGKMKDFIIKPACFDSLYASMSDPSHVVIVFGPSGCGKTFIVKQIAHEIYSYQSTEGLREFDYINCQINQGAEQEIREKLQDINSRNRIIIDGFHALNKETRQFVINESIRIMESGSQTLLVIVGNTSLNNILINSISEKRFEDLYDVYPIDFSTHSSASIRNMMDKVAESLEIKFGERLKAEIVNLSVDNIYIANFLIVKFMQQLANDISTDSVQSVFNLQKGVLSYSNESDLYEIVENIGLGEMEKFFKNFQTKVPITASILKTISIHPKRGVISFKRLKFKSDNETTNTLNEITDKLKKFKALIENKEIVSQKLSEQFKQSFDYQEDQEKLIIRDIQTLFYLNYSSIKEKN
jgi:ATPase family associated with various cellular activities (AAA)